MNNELITCKACKEAKDISEFHTFPSRNNYRFKNCKICVNKKKARIRIYQPSQTPESKRRYDQINKQRHPERWMLKQAKQRAKAYGLPFDLELSDIVIPEFCPVFNIKLQAGKGQKIDSSPSIDRLRPELGYVKGNIAVISLRANQLKSNGTVREHEILIDWMKSKNL